jgi:hypothetical protein
LTWTITGATVDDAKGGPMKVILRFRQGNITNIWFSIKIKRSSALLWQSGSYQPDATQVFQIRDIVTFNFPPWLRGQTGNDDVDFILCGQQESGGALPVNLDTMFLIPADGYRYLYLANDNAANTERVVDDGIEGFQYVDNGAGANKRSAILAYGSPIFVEPNKLQRLYFLSHSSIGTAAQKDRKLTVKLYYRPRRINL